MTIASAAFFVGFLCGAGAAAMFHGIQAYLRLRTFMAAYQGKTFIVTEAEKAYKLKEKIAFEERKTPATSAR